MALVIAISVSSTTCCLLLLLLAGATGAVEYSATNPAAGTQGGDRFNAAVGLDYAKQVMAEASSYIWTVFQQQSAPKPIDRVALVVETMGGVAYTSADVIHLSAGYVGGYSGTAEEVRREVVGVLYHELTHVWQFNGRSEGAAPQLVEGIADYVRLRAGYPARGWVGPGGGSRWNEGYSVTARFLEYCSGLRSSFVAELNAKMRDGYSDAFFVELLGKTVDELWSDYKARYPNN